MHIPTGGVTRPTPIMTVTRTPSTIGSMPTDMAIGNMIGINSVSAAMDSMNIVTMKKFMKGVDDLLSDGHLILVYPEQSMWWNYRKPKPLQRGAYFFAYRNDVPVVPCFITMKDSDLMGDDGFYVQEYTIHVSEPIYPDKSLPYRAAVTELMDKNYALWKEIYEREYDMPLVYDTENGDADAPRD